jgi:hypothetical protein
MNASEGTLFYKDKFNRPLSAPVKLFSRKLKAQFPNDRGPGRQLGRLESDTKIVADVAQEVLMELNREVVADLANVAATHISHKWQSPKNLFDAILVASAGIAKKIGVSANWLVASNTIVEEIAKLEDWQPFDSKEGIWTLQKVGRLSNKWDVYADPMLEPNTIVMGHKGDEARSGYFYCPYIAIDQTAERILLLRTGKKLIDGGCYSRITLENYYTEEEIYAESPVVPERNIPFKQEYIPDEEEYVEPEETNRENMALDEIMDEITDMFGD